MANIIKVSTSKLTSTASAFQGSSSKVKNLTSQMTQIVTSLSGNVWSGDASSAYVNKFKGLQDDINKMVKMIDEHVSDLNQMAREYEAAENTNQQQASSLSSDVTV